MGDFTIEGKQEIFVVVTHRNIPLNGKQDDFPWKLYESKMTFVESSSKKILQKALKAVGHSFQKLYDQRTHRGRC